MNDAVTTDPETSWVVRHGWLLAATWLVFLAFPWVAILADDELSMVTRATASGLLVGFAVVYVNGFRRVHAHGWGRTSARVDVAVLVAMGGVLVAVAGPAGLGVTPFVVVFAAFHFSWWTAVLALVVGVALTVLVPLAAGALDELWSLALLVTVVGVAALLIRSVDASQSRQAELRTRLAISDERNRVARDVHDVLGHSLTAVILKAELSQKLLEGVEPEDEQARERLASCRQQLDELGSVGRRALAEIRATVGGLRAANLADEVTVARTVLADAGVELVVTGQVSEVPDALQPVLAWVVREAVTNVVRHAGASRCEIALGSATSPGRVVLRITDDGVGIGTATGNGLRGVRERVEAAGGELRLRSDDGTTVEVVR